jgi:hypothetical protein
MYYCKNKRSDGDSIECSRAAWNYLKNRNARNRPPTSYHYGNKSYFLQTSLSTTLYYRRREKQILNFLYASALNMFRHNSDAVSWLEIFLKKYYLPETLEGNGTKYSEDSRGWKIESHDMLHSVGNRLN